MKSATGKEASLRVEEILARLESGAPVRERLEGGGRIHLERPLPFLCVYRKPPGRADPGADRLVVSEASYLLSRAGGEEAQAVATFARRLSRALAERFGAFLIVEVWTGGGRPRGADRNGPPVPARPSFRLYEGAWSPPERTLEAFERALKRVVIAGWPANVERVSEAPPHAPGLPALLNGAGFRDAGIRWAGLEVHPLWRSPEGEEYPLLRRRFVRRFARALRRGIFEFVRHETRHTVPHYHALGRRVLNKAAYDVDRELAEISSAFDFLLLLTPINAESAYAEFKRSRYADAPRFLYRPLPVDPDLLKRRLYTLPLEKVEDPTLYHIFHDKRTELDRQLSMLADRDTIRCLYGSLQLYGAVDDALLGNALRILEAISPRSREAGGDGARSLDAAAFAERARAALRGYRRKWPDLGARVEVRRDIAQGLMVSHGDLLIGPGTRVPAGRVRALIAHEVETHILTYYNGRAQPLHLLYCGMGGYEALQEGLAVLAEYLVGGLSRPRLRLLAGRVVAARLLQEGATFVDTFRELTRVHGFARRTAFTMTVRVYRGGGLTKDAVYLRGLLELLDYLRRGGAFEPLLVGKIAGEDVPLVQELRRRGVLRDPPLEPAYLRDLEARRRLERVRGGLDVLSMVNPPVRKST